MLLSAALICCLLFFSCKTDKKANKPNEMLQIATKWIGKEIIFPNGISCSVSGRDTALLTCVDLLDKEYKVLLYADSMGCSACRLRLSQWKEFIYESDSLFVGKLGFVFFLQPKCNEDMPYLFETNNFNYPVFIDVKNSINHLNNFPQATKYQCFLLDRKNKVIYIGNPTYKYSIWQMYLKAIKDNITVEKLR
jgi:hypothetical protein